MTQLEISSEVFNLLKHAESSLAKSLLETVGPLDPYHQEMVAAAAIEFNNVEMLKWMLQRAPGVSEPALVD